MATKNITTCDRCGSECKDRHGRRDIRKITVDEKEMDLCPSCGAALAKWLERDNATMPGDDPGWEEVCTHQIPCGGPCHSGVYRRVGR